MAAPTSTQCRGACARGGGGTDGSGSSSSSDGNDVGNQCGSETPRVKDAGKRGRTPQTGPLDSAAGGRRAGAAGKNGACQSARDEAHA